MRDRLDPKWIADKTQRSAIEKKQKRNEPLLPEERAFLNKEKENKMPTRPTTSNQSEPQDVIGKKKGRDHIPGSKKVETPLLEWEKLPYNRSTYRFRDSNGLENFLATLKQRGIENRSEGLVEYLLDRDNYEVGTILDEDLIDINNNHPLAGELKGLLADVADWVEDDKAEQ